MGKRGSGARQFERVIHKGTTPATPIQIATSLRIRLPQSGVRRTRLALSAAGVSRRGEHGWRAVGG